jgi:hypothetical protein
MAWQYFAVLTIPDGPHRGGNVDDPRFLFRYDFGRAKHERFNRTELEWVEDPELARYTHQGEVGAEEVTEQQARKVVEQWKP